MIWLEALLVVAAALALLHALRLLPQAARARTFAQQAFRDLRDPRLAERDKERLARAAAGRLLLQCLRLAATCAIALGVPLGVAAILDSCGLLDLRAVAAALVSWPLLLASVLLAVPLFVLRRSER